jgi:hypothetical protein
MKQGRQAVSGAKRQEVAKTWRRNEAGVWEPRHQVAAHRWEDAEGDETPREDPTVLRGATAGLAA